jgi:micrococcal nuclease
VTCGPQISFCRAARAAVVMMTTAATVPVAAQSAPDTADPCSGKTATAAVVATSAPLTLKLSDGRDIVLAGVLLPPRPLGLEATAAWPPSDEAQAAFAALLPPATNTGIVAPDGAKDRYGRLRAQVCIERDGQWVWLQRRLVETGHAIVFASGATSSLETRLFQAEAMARDAKMGLWANAVNQVFDAKDPSPLKRRRLQFTIAEGRVADVARRGSRTYLNFGTNWRDDFTVLVANAVADQSTLVDGLASLEGHRVRVRGWIEERGGPAIELLDLANLEDLGAD